MSRSNVFRTIGSIGLAVLSVIYMVPLLLVLMNSFKGNLFISQSFFAWPNSKSFSAVHNYSGGLVKTGFVSALG